MAYSNQTSNYGLPLPLGSDKSTWLDNNTAFQAIDTALKGAVDGVAALSGTTGGISEALTGLTNRVDGIDTDITQLKNADGTIVGNFGPVETGQVSAHEYVAGDMFVWLNVIRKATVAIHVGDQFVNGTNCVIVSLDEIIGNLNVINDLGSISEALSVNHWVKIAEIEGDGVNIWQNRINSLYPLISAYINTDYDLIVDHYYSPSGTYNRYRCGTMIPGTSISFYSLTTYPPRFLYEDLTIQATGSLWVYSSAYFTENDIHRGDYQNEISTAGDKLEVYAKLL